MDMVLLAASFIGFLDVVCIITVVVFTFIAFLLCNRAYDWGYRKGTYDENKRVQATYDGPKKVKRGVRKKTKKKPVRKKKVRGGPLPGL